MIRTLRQCGNDFARENMMQPGDQPARPSRSPRCCPASRVNTAPNNYHPIRQMQLMRWDGKGWERFGDIIEGAKV